MSEYLIRRSLNTSASGAYEYLSESRDPSSLLPPLMTSAATTTTTAFTVTEAGRCPLVDHFAHSSGLPRVQDIFQDPGHHHGRSCD